MQRNYDVVAYTPQKEASWIFCTSGKACNISEVTDEILGITKKMLYITNDFFIPTKIIYGFQLFSKDDCANSIFNENTKPLEGGHREITSNNGISVDMLRDDINNIEVKKDEIRYIGRIDLDGKTKFILKNKELFIDKKSRGLYYDCDDDMISEKPPEVNPIRIDINHSGLKRQDQRVERTDPAYYKIVFWTSTDIWFENTEIGTANNNRLKSIFNKISDNFNVSDTLYLSD